MGSAAASLPAPRRAGPEPVPAAFVAAAGLVGGLGVPPPAGDEHDDHDQRDDPDEQDQQTLSADATACCPLLGASLRKLRG